MYGGVYIMFKIEEELLEEINGKIEGKETVILSNYEASHSRGCSAMRCSGSCGVLIR